MHRRRNRFKPRKGALIRERWLSACAWIATEDRLSSYSTLVPPESPSLVCWLSLTWIMIRRRGNLAATSDGSAGWFFVHVRHVCCPQSFLPADQVWELSTFGDSGRKKKPFFIPGHLDHPLIWMTLTGWPPPGNVDEWVVIIMSSVVLHTLRSEGSGLVITFMSGRHFCIAVVQSPPWHPGWMFHSRQFSKVTLGNWLVACMFQLILFWERKEDEEENERGRDKERWLRAANPTFFVYCNCRNFCLHKQIHELN